MLGWFVRGLSAVEAATATKSSTGPEPVGWTHSAACSGDLFRTTQETNAFVIHKPHSSRRPVPTLRRFLWTHSIDDDSTFSSSQYEVSLLIFLNGVLNYWIFYNENNGSLSPGKRHTGQNSITYFSCWMLLLKNKFDQISWCWSNQFYPSPAKSTPHWVGHAQSSSNFTLVQCFKHKFLRSFPHVIH